MSRIFFTVIIPTLNEEAFLPRLLKCLASQKFRDFETIVVDGNSTDKTVSLARKAGVRVIRSKKRNVSYQRNIGAGAARGEYLVFIDADCRVAASYLSKASRILRKQKGLLYISPMKSERTDPEVMMLYNVLNKIAELTLPTNKPMPTIGTLLIEKHFFHRIGEYDESLFIGEDVQIVHKAVQWGVRPRFMNGNFIINSYRRFLKEGRLKSLSKFLLSSAHILLKGDIKKKLYNYEMGGHLYDTVPASSKHAKRSRTK